MNDVVERVARADGPVRIQLSRKKGWRMPPNTVSVARPGRHGNTFKIGMQVCSGHGQGFQQIAILTRADAVEAFRAMTKLPTRNYPSDEEIRRDLVGKNLACWCPLDQPCHADVLLELANSDGSKPAEPIMCGGCGATSNDQRCMGCMHDFGTPDSAWVRKYHSSAALADASPDIGKEGKPL